MGIMNDLIHDLVTDIAQWLTSYSDYVNFRSVCRSWWSIVPKKPEKLPCDIPCLILPCIVKTYCDFFSLFGGEESENYMLEIPEVQTHVCKGSSHGWLIMVDKYSTINLINPLTNARMQLPPIDTFPGVLEYKLNNPYRIKSRSWVQCYFIRKLVLSSSPGDDKDDCIAMAIYGENSSKAACCKLGDERWKLVSVEVGYESSKLVDIIHHSRRFYILNQHGSIFDIHEEEADGHSPRATLFVRGPGGYVLEGNLLYLVISNGDFLIASRPLIASHRRNKKWRDNANIDDNYNTVNFKVFRLSTSESKWTKVDNVGNNLLFLGQNETFCIPTCRIPRPCTRSCIYFTDDYTEGHYNRENDMFVSKLAGSDMGVFHMETCSVQKLPLPSRFQGREKQILPLPIWIKPNA